MKMPLFNLGNLKTAFTGGGSSQNAQPANAFNKVLNAASFTVTGTSNSAYTAGQYTKIAYLAVPAQQAYQWGYGTSAFPDNQGYLYVALKDTANAAVAGSIRFSIADANELNEVVVMEYRTDILAGSTTLKTQQVAMPRNGPIAHYNDRLIIKLNADASSGNGTFSQTLSTILTPVTLYAPTSP